MRSAYKVKVNQPCEQHWAGMEKQDKGLYCQECTKVVLDFTKMSDDDLLELLSKPRKGATCGVFSNEQMEKVYYLPSPEPKSGWGRWKALLLGLLTLKAVGEPMNAKAMASYATSENVEDRNQENGITIKGELANGLRARIVVKDVKSQTMVFKQSMATTGSFSINLDDSLLGNKVEIYFYGEGLPLSPIEIVLDREVISFDEVLFKAEAEYALIKSKREEVELREQHYWYGGIEPQVIRLEIEEPDK